MKRNSIVFGFVGNCAGIAFKGTAQEETGDRAVPVLASLQLRGIFGATSAGEMVAARGIIVGEHSGHKSRTSFRDEWRKA
jgi:hypothetical protein